MSGIGDGMIRSCGAVNSRVLCDYVVTRTVALGVIMTLLLHWLPTAAQEIPEYFVEADVDNSQPYVGQQVRYTFRLFDAVALDNPLYEPPPFEGFWRLDVGDVSQTTQVINNQTYTVTELRTTLFPTRSGDIVIDPARLVLPETVFAPERVILSNPVTVQVRSLPGAVPSGFAGAVGQFAMEASIDRNQVQVGEMLTLEVAISGNGNIEQLPAPLVTPPIGWRMVENPARFAATVDSGVVIGRKVFTFVLLAETVGVSSLDAIVLHFFDPLSASFRQISTGSIAIEALPDPDRSASAESAPALASTPLPLKRIHVGEMEPTLGTGFWLLWLLPPLLVVSAWGAQIARRWMQKYRTAKRRQQALQIALRQLENLLNTNDQGRGFVFGRLIGVLNEYLDAKTGILKELVGMDAHIVETTNELPDGVRQRLLAACEVVREGMYAPAESIEAGAILKHVRDVLIEADKLW
ncbi:MAG: BatD family protein [Anaerolineae bacterium]|nr:BatD family protein [Anaerolineae bacterium]